LYYYCGIWITFISLNYRKETSFQMNFMFNRCNSSSTLSFLTLSILTKACSFYVVFLLHRIDGVLFIRDLWKIGFSLFVDQHCGIHLMLLTLFPLSLRVDCILGSLCLECFQYLFNFANHFPKLVITKVQNSKNRNTLNFVNT
jgi:hypothetical protein